MASSTPFGIISQTEAVTKAVEEEIESDESPYAKETRGQPSEKSRRESFIDSADEEDLKPQIHELARTLTHHSVKDGQGEYINPFEETDNPILNPGSEKFNYQAWMKTVLAIHSRDPERFPKRVAGVAYKNLSAHGFGEATDYQKTFGNYPLEIPSLLKRMSGRRQQTKIQILRNFDGLIRSGEMLVVLGRPGR